MPSTNEQGDPPSDPPKEVKSDGVISVSDDGVGVVGNPAFPCFSVDPPEAHYDLKDPAGLAGFLIDSDIKLVRAEYLRSLLDADGRFPRRQEAETTTFTDGTGASRTALVSHEEVQAWADEPKRAVICSISHAWEAREHPDPCGHQLLQVVHHTALYVAAYFAEIWVFFDYVSLFQYLRESEAQQASFGLAMANMHVMYSHESSVTLRVETLTPERRWAKALDEEEMITVFDASSKVVKPVLIKDLVHNPTPYQNRGWCIGEMEWSSDRQATAQNQLIDIRSDTTGQHELLGRVPTSPEHFAVKMDTAAFTHRSDAPAVVHLQEKIFLEKVRRNAELSLEGLPRSQILALAHALPYFEVLQTITLVDFECSQEEADTFAKALRDTKVLKFHCRAKIQYRDTFKQMIQALAVVLNETCIAELNFSRKDYYDDARMDVATVEVLAKALETNSHVTHLNLEYSLIEVKGIKALTTALKSNTTVVDVNLAGHFDCRDEGAEALAEMLSTNRTLTHLNLQSCTIGVKGIKALATALKLNDTVVDLNLADNWQCADEGAEAMAVVLSTNAAIKRLNLESCRIRDAGVEALASALRINRVLTHLRLHGNDVGVQGAEALASALMVNRVVAADWNQDDSLSANLPCRSPFGASTRLQALADALRINQRITWLNLQGSKIGDDLKALADALCINQTIARLDLQDNEIGDQGMKVLADALRVNTTITQFYLYDNDNPIGDEGVKALAAALEANTTIKDVGLSDDQLTDEGMQGLERIKAICEENDERERELARAELEMQKSP